EKKYGIVRRFQVSNISETQNFFGKFIPIILTVTAGMGVATIITILLYDINWGNSIISAIIVFLMIVAGTALGMMIYNITDSLVITIILQFTVVWFLGFFGGSFETYMFSNISDVLKQLSPIYHGNRALVELSCMGESSYVVSAVVYSAVITVICSIIAIFAGYVRKRGKV
ncbi:MAG: ABC transporter permease, partial [Acutalibacteraceae bacterium]|nr:ABC transporter permease [Acutalibacteraceae bacterium]